MVNGDFEGDRIGELPTGWFIPKPSTEAGYTLDVTDSSAMGGSLNAHLNGSSAGERAFGNCMQSVDAKPFRGKRVRFAAAVRCEPQDEQSSAMLWLRVDRPDQQRGFFDNMGDRPIQSANWQRYEIVGDIAEDADFIALGMMLVGGGSAWLDDAVLEVAPDTAATTGVAVQAQGAPGLSVATYAAEAHVMQDIDATLLRFPLPLAYRDQVPVTFNLEVEPADTDARVRITEGAGPNRVLELELTNLQAGTDLTLRYESVVLVAPTSFDKLPSQAGFPAEWPEEARPWLTATWCCNANDERIKEMGAEIRAANGEVKAVIDAVLSRSQSIVQAASGRVQNLTAVEALDKQGSCTSCANLVAALLRAAGVPSRILAGYPLWSGALQTHYIVEAYIPGFGWYPVESTLGQAPWPNFQQVNVSIVPIENETEPLAGQRFGAAGGVPFMTLTEYAQGVPIALQGTLKPYCDHEARLLRSVESDAAEWQATQEWARQRWDTWLQSKPELRAGKVVFGPASDALAAKTLSDLRSELR